MVLIRTRAILGKGRLQHSGCSYPHRSSITNTILRYGHSHSYCSLLHHHYSSSTHYTTNGKVGMMTGKNYCQNPILNLYKNQSNSHDIDYRCQHTLSDPQPPSSLITPSTDDRNTQDQDLIMEKLVIGPNGETIVTLTFNRPKAANAMGKNMLSQLQDAISYLNNDKKEEIIRCIILKSSSPKVFSAGADLKERSTMTPTQTSNFVTNLRQTFHDLSILPIPILSCIDGVALGGGLEIALTSDVILASERAVFGLPEVTLGIVPGAGGTQRLGRWVGSARAKEMIFTGSRIDAWTALEYGLVQHVVKDEDYESGGGSDGVSGVEKKALEIATQIAQNGPLAIRAAKRAIQVGIDGDDNVSPSSTSSSGAGGLTMNEKLELERKCYETIIPTMDRLEGLTAFREKRKPVYKGH